MQSCTYVRRSFITLGIVGVLSAAAFAQDQTATPNYQKIAGILRNIAADFGQLADEVAKMEPPAPPPPVTHPPITPPPLVAQTPLLTDARLAYFKSLQATNAPDWQMLKTVADADTPQYDDNGRAAAIIYRTTGDKAYATKAYKFLMLTIGPGQSGDVGNINGNYAREWMIELPLVYSYIKDALTADEQKTCEAALMNCVDYALGRNQKPGEGGIRNSDSDLALGEYFGLVVTQGLGIGHEDFLSQTTGGPTPTKLGGLVATGADFTTTRNSINLYLTKYAKGGTWFESCTYNSNTVMLLLMGWAASRDLYGKEYFPEVAAWIPDACDAVLVSFTPDFKGRLEWGDDDRAGSSDFYKQIPLVAALQDAAWRVGDFDRAAKVGAMLQKMRTIYTGNVIRQRLYYFLGVPVSPKPYYDGVGPLANYSPGVGLYSRWDKQNMLVAFCPSHLDVDHALGFVADLQWWVNDEWVLHHPIIYEDADGSALGNNAVLVSGLSAMWNRGPVAAVTTPDYTYFVGASSGKYYGPDKWADPAAWCFELTRTAFYMPKLGVILICDRVNSIDPPGVDDYYFRPDANAVDAEKAKGPGHRHQIVWHMPVVPSHGAFGKDGVSITWPTPGGQKVEIDTYATTGPLVTDVIDELKAGIVQTTSQAAQQTRVRFTADNQFDVVLSCVKVDPSITVTPITQPGVAGFVVNGTTVLFGTDQDSRLIDPTKVTASPGQYLVGCSGDAEVVVRP